MLLHGAEGLDALGNRIPPQFGGIQRLMRLPVLLIAGGQGILRRAQGSVIFVQRCGIPVHALLASGNIRRQRRSRFLIALHVRKNPAPAVTPAVSRVLQHGQAHPHIHRLRLTRADVRPCHINAFGKLVDAPPERLLLRRPGGILRLHLGQSAAQGCFLLPVIAFPSARVVPGGIRRADRLLRRPDALARVQNMALAHPILAVQPVQFLGYSGNLPCQLSCRFPASPVHLGQALVLYLQRLQGILRLRQVKLRVGTRRSRRLDLAQQTSGIIQPQADVRLPACLQQNNALFCFFRLARQRADLRLDFGKDIPDAHHVRLGRIQPPLCLGLSHAVTRDAGRILKNAPAFLALAGNHLGDASLPDDGVAVPPDAGVQEQLVDIPEAHRLAVDEVFRLSAPEIAPRDGHAVIGAVQPAEIRCIVEGHGHLGIAHRAAAVRTAENDILHLAPAQGLGGYLPQHPAHGIRDV